MTTTTSLIRLVIRQSDGSLNTQPLPVEGALPAEADSSYALVLEDGGHSPEGLALKRRDDDLLVEVGGDTVLVLADYFQTDGVVFLPQAHLAQGELTGHALDLEALASSGSADDAAVVWSAQGSETSDDGTPLLWGAGILGGIALAAGGSGGSGSSAPGVPPSEPEPEPLVNNTVAGRIVAGPVIDGNGLTVDVFQADGETLLGSAKVGADGRFTLDVGDYTGVVIARVRDENADPDYLDEATSRSKDLNAELSAVSVISEPNSTIEININPLTTLAAGWALKGEGALTADGVVAANQAIADLFGLEDLHALVVEAVNGDGFDSSDGLSPGEAYGLILAAISGADQANGGDSQATLDRLLEALQTDDTGRVTLDEAGQLLLQQGADVMEQVRGDLPSNIVDTVVDTLAPVFTSPAQAQAVDENSGAGQVVYTATATDAGRVSFALKPGNNDDAGQFRIDATTGAVTLLPDPDFEARASYSFTVVATDAAGNSSEQAVTLAINDLDETPPSQPDTTAPVITSGETAAAIDENSGAGQVVHVAAATDNQGAVTFRLGPDSDPALAIDAASGAVTLANDPDHETQASYSFTVVATDAAGNSSEQTVTLAVTDRDESAPVITSAATAPAIDENSGADQVVYTAAATDTADTDDATDTSDALVYSLKAGSDPALSINADSGEVTLADDPDHEAQASYSFTVVATDAGGNSAEQAVSLAVNNLDDSSPVITSGTEAAPVSENSGPNQVVYTATSTDSDDVSTGTTTYSLKAGSDAALGIDADSGQVTLSDDPDHETQSSYSFTVVATDAAGNSSERAVTLAVTDRDESAPTITSAATASAIAENSGVDQVVYTATATDTADIDDATDTSGALVYSLKAGSDDALSIEADSGQVTLSDDPDHETQSSYSFTVVATDAAGNSSERAVTLNINDRDESAPTITSGATAPAIAENSGADQVVYTATATDTADTDDATDTSGALVYSLKAGSDDALGIDADSGQVTLSDDPDHETQSSYSFTVVATDAAGNSSERAVTLAINDLDESAPTITSAATAPAIAENSGADQVVYTATATDTADIDDATDTSGALVYSLKAGSDDALSIDADSGQVTLSDDPDYETQSSYSFTVVATDAAGNSSEQAVTLAINDLADETAPTVSSVAITSASGIQNERLNEGDTVTVTVTMDEATVVDTTDGTPRIALTIGGSTVFADYVSGSGSTALEFQYTIMAGQTDADGISVAANALELNGGTVKDAAGNAADLAHALVADNADYLVDTTAPTASVVTAMPTTVLKGVGFDYEPQITALGNDGAFAVTWYGEGPDGDSIIYVQRFDTSGTAQGSPVQLGPDGVVSGYDSAAQITALGSEGAFVVTWQGPDTDGDESIFVQRFDSSGTAQGSPVLLEPDGVTTGTDTKPQAIALGNNGDFAVTWAGNDGSDSSIFVQRFDAAGAAQGSPTLIEPSGVTGNSDSSPQITALGSDGAFVITWQGIDAGGDSSIFVQRFDGTGAAQGSPTQLEPDGVTNGSDISAQITALGSDGAFAVTWNGPDAGGDTSIFVQRFDTSGATVGTPVLLEPNGVSNGADYSPQITALGSDGAFAVTWYGSDGNDSSIFVQRFDTSGTAQGNPILLEPDGVTSGHDYDPQITAVGSSGAFVVTWWGSDGDKDSIFVQRFDTSGTAQGSPILLETDGVTNGGEYSPQITALGNNGAFVVTWYGEDADGEYDVFVQRFNADGSTTAPTTFQPGQAVTVQSSEVGIAYLVHSSVNVTDVASITAAANTLWVSASVSAADSNTVLDTTGLADGTYSVYSTDAAGNLSAAAATTITSDGTAPAFDSGGSATAIAENSGAGQTVYTASASDTTAVSYSLKAGDDAASFSIDAVTGEVTLTDDPDYETKPSYNFTVVATDVVGNSSEQAVTLDINDIADETPPSVDSVAITSASGIQNERLNEGDTVTVTVTMDEATVVDTTDGTPRIALNIGGSTAYASYAGGTGTTALTFTYTVLPGDTDTDGISIDANALETNGGTLRDAAGNAASLTHTAVTDNGDYRVDTTAPTLSSSTPTDNAGSVAVDDNIVLTFSENVQAGSGDITLSNGAGDTRVIAVGDGQVSINNNQVTINPTADLNVDDAYYVQIDAGALTDAAGNAFAGIDDETTFNFETESSLDTSIVVFDLVEGVSSSHSGRVFDANTSYTIYIRMQSDSHVLSTDGASANPAATWGIWTGSAGTLGSDDKIVYVGDGSPIIGNMNKPVTATGTDGAGGFFLWSGSLSASFAVFASYAYLSRAVDGTRGFATLWNANEGTSHHLWASAQFPMLGLPQHYLTQMPADILTSQGLA